MRLRYSSAYFRYEFFSEAGLPPNALGNSDGIKRAGAVRDPGSIPKVLCKSHQPPGGTLGRRSFEGLCAGEECCLLLGRRAPQPCAQASGVSADHRDLATVTQSFYLAP